MSAAGFTLKIKASGGVEPGSWLAPVDVDGQRRLIPIDLIVPGALVVGHGRRDARLPDHGQHAARWADGLEAAVIDHSPMTVASLDPVADPRQLQVHVAGIPALLVAKAYKLYDRLQEPDGRPHRVRDKDAGDVIRLMRGPMDASAVGERLAALADDEVAGASVRAGVEHLRMLFAATAAPGVEMAVVALATALDDNQVRVLAPGFIADMLETYSA